MTEHPRTAIVTGASSGIGLGLTHALLGSGYRVVGNSRHITTADTLAPSDHLALVEGDIASAAVADRIVETALERFGRIDLLVNNAGIFIPKPFVDYTAEDFERLTATNLTGFFHITQRAMRRMREQRSGHIVTITTTLVDQPLAEVPAALPILTKGGLNAATGALAIEGAPHGIRVNAVAPGIVDTPMHQAEMHEFLSALHPIRRLATVDEIAEAVLYLDRAEFVSGEILRVDGAAHAGRW